MAPANNGGALSQAAFNKQLKPIKDKLREMENIEIPFLDRGPMNITTELTKQLARKGGAFLSMSLSLHYRGGVASFAAASRSN